MSGSLSVRLGLACFAGGVILLYRLTALPPLQWLILVTVLAFLPALWSVWANRTENRSSLFVLPCVLMAGACWAAWHAHTVLDERLDSAFEGKPLEVSGVLCGVPEPGSFGSVRFPFCVTTWHATASEGMPSRLRLAWYGEAATLALPSRLKLTVVLKQPHGAVNPEGFRYESWLFRQAYGATGTVRALAEDSGAPCDLVCRYHQWRAELVRNLDQQVGHLASAPLIQSLMLGYRGELGSQHWQVLKATGTIHLVAISGLHLGLVAIGAGFLVRRLLILLPEPWLPPGRMRALSFALIVGCCLLYALAAGFTVPTRRALIMVMVGCWWVLNARQGPAFDGVLMALCLVLLVDPLSPLDQGFWLSFGAVAVLILVFGGLLGQRPWWQSLLIAQIALFAALWPILAVLNQSQPAVGFVANLVAIPVVSVVIMPALFFAALAMFVLPALSGPMLGVLDQLLEWLWRFLEWAAALQMPRFEPSMVELVMAAMALSVALIVPSHALRTLSAVSITAWLAVSAQSVESTSAGHNAVATESPEVWIWDVGQGLSVLVRQAGQTLLYDTGPELEGVYSAVESVLVPNLNALGVRRIDTLVVSHADNDHAGGIPMLMDRFEIGRIISGEPERLVARLSQAVPDSRRSDSSEHPPIHACRSSQGDGEMLYQAWRFKDAVEGNDASCVLDLWFHQGRQRMTLSGDITDTTERLYLADRLTEAPAETEAQFRVALAPHHGSKTSSSEHWIESMKPDLVIVSAGYRHRYGHPHPDVVARYRSAGSQILNTASSGAIQLRFLADGVRVRQTRVDAPFWIARPDSLARPVE